MFSIRRSRTGVLSQYGLIKFNKSTGGEPIAHAEFDERVRRGCLELWSFGTPHYDFRMCMMVYVASDRPLPRIPWHDDSPSLHVADLDETAMAVRDRFTLPYVCYVGSHKGCGCGFQCEEHPDLLDEEDELLCHESRANLTKLLQEQLASGNRLQLYACWAGDEHERAKHSREAVPEQLMTGRMHFLEREFIDFVPSQVV